LRDIQGIWLCSTPSAALRSVGDEMVVDVLRVVACPWHMAIAGEPRQLPGGIPA